MEKFLRALPIYEELKRFFDSSIYTPVPDDWCVVAADVRGSTQAIAEGLYRDVNFVGAANITALLTHLGPNLPFCFGGDGAAILIAQHQQLEAERILRSLCYWSKQCFNLELHAGVIPVAMLRENGSDVKIAKYKLLSGPSQTLFIGGGLSLAERMVKTEAIHRVTPSPELSQTEVFSGLTCRWKPIPASNGVVVSLLVEPMKGRSSGLSFFIEKIESVFGGGFSGACPINMRHAHYHSFIHNLKRQLKVSGFQFSKRIFSELIELLMTVPLFNFKAFHFIPVVNNYINKIPQHCDFQKLDDTLRMVLDCTELQVSQIQALLKYHQDRGDIAYGLHMSSESQMTCYVESLSDHQHLHFVDGSDGGYALAATMLKQRLKGG